jgi:hypothetical protein
VSALVTTVGSIKSKPHSKGNIIWEFAWRFFLKRWTKFLLVNHQIKEEATQIHQDLQDISDCQCASKQATITTKYILSLAT